MNVEVAAVSETGIMVCFGQSIDVELIEKIALFSRAVQERYQGKLYDVVPSYTTVMIEYHPLHVEAEEILQWCRQQALSIASSNTVLAETTVITFPVYYHPDVAPDLQPLAKDRNLTVEQVIAIHSQTEYTVCAIGFAPGFAFLGSVDSRIATPRHAEPRLKVAKGSVGIADSQTAIYPQQTPGGWQIIGNCPIDLFDVTREPMMPFSVGDKVRFESISRQRFIELGGVI